MADVTLPDGETTGGPGGGPPSPYDPDPAANRDPWFAPAPDDDAAAFPLRSRDRDALLFDPADWGAAQDALSRPLADLALLVGALDERLRGAGPEAAAGLCQRLALAEVADLGWWTGDRIGIERLALWTGARIGAVGDDAQAMMRAGWAVRRLAAGPGPSEGGWHKGLAAFLGRAAPDRPDAPDTILDLAEVMERAKTLHPVTQAAMLFHAWRMIGADIAAGEGAGDDLARALVGARGAAPDVEAAVMAARHGATMARRGGGLLFLPLALTGPGALRATGAVPDRLGRWIEGATQATLAAILHLDRIAGWAERATRGTDDMSGRAPRHLVALFSAWPMVSAPMAEELTTLSRAAIQRNLDQLTARGLIREVTGQGRYRVWSATL